MSDELNSVNKESEEEYRLIVTLTNEDGEDLNVEIIDTMEYDGAIYTAFVPADMDEDDPDFSMIIFRNGKDEDGEPVFDPILDDALYEEVYNKFLSRLFEEEDDYEFDS